VDTGAGGQELPVSTQELAENQARELARVAFRSFLVEEFANAERVARDAMAVDPANLLAQTVVANCLAVRGVNKPSVRDLDDAEDLVKSLLDHDSKNGFAHNALGLTRLGSGDLKRAEKEFALAIDLDGELAMAEANLGYVRLQLGKLKQAEKAYRAAIRARPEAAVSHNGLAQVLLARGKPGDAAKAARAAISRYELQDEYLGAFYVNLAVALQHDGRSEQATEAIARAKTLGVVENPAYEIIEDSLDRDP
jgi:tetratricopeptide (TPR) repeat protein